MCKPSRVNLTSEKKSFFLECSYVTKLLLRNCIVNSYVCSNPMTLLNIFDPVNIILIALNSEIKPHFAKCLNIRFIISVKSIFILYLQKNNTAFRILSCLQMFFYYWNQRFKVYFNLR